MSQAASHQQKHAIKQLQEGIALHNAGRLDEADARYKKVLAELPKHPDANHLRALICHAKGEYKQALHFAEIAIAAAPKTANFYNTAGDCLRRLNAPLDAIERLQTALLLAPDFALAHHNLALCLEETGQLDDARRSNQRALSLAPNHGDALIQGLRLAMRADDIGAADNLANQLAHQPAQARQAAALAAYQLYCLKKLIAEGDFASAENAAKTLLAHDPENAPLWLASGELYNLQNRFAEAEHALHNAARFGAGHEDTRLGIALFLLEQQRFAEAARHYADWLETHPDSAAAQFGLGWIDLAERRFANGWRRFEARWQLPEHPSPKYIAAPDWQGGPARHLLLYAEQGLGDSVMFLRFLPQVLQREVSAITLLVQPPLARIARSVSTDARLNIVTELPAAPNFDAACALMSLPRALALSSADQHRADAPYLFADPARSQYFRDRLAPLSNKKKVGLIWAGGAAGAANQRRALDLARLQALFARPELALISLQHGQPLPFSHPATIDLAADITDFHDLAAAMMTLDLVISLDSGPAHLAGALGQPCLTLVPWLHDWRWGIAGEQSLWYSEMRLIRQGIGEDWAAVMRALEDWI